MFILLRDRCRFPWDFVNILLVSVSVSDSVSGSVNDKASPSHESNDKDKNLHHRESKGQTRLTTYLVPILPHTVVVEG